MYKLKPGD